MIAERHAGGVASESVVHTETRWRLQVINSSQNCSIKKDLISLLFWSWTLERSGGPIASIAWAATAEGKEGAALQHTDGTG